METEIDILFHGQPGENSGAEWVTWVEPGQVAWARTVTGLAPLGIGAVPDVSLLFFDFDDPLLQIWDRLPAKIAAMAADPAAHYAAIFRRADLAGDLPRSPHEVWQRLMQVASRHNAFATQATVATGGPSPDDAPVVSPRFPALAPSEPPASRSWLKTTILEVASGDIPQSADATALAAGLLQLNDFLDASHNLSQSIEGEGRSRAGDYWHGIMHRREPDYSNAKYWFRRVGTHPVFPALGALTVMICNNHGSPVARRCRDQLAPGGRWDALAFVDMCEEAASSSDAELINLAERIQFTEMLLLLEHTYRDATA